MHEKNQILVVDDDMGVLNSLNLWLSSEGFSTFTASNPEQAVEIIKKNEIAVCLLDLKLKDQNGLTVSAELKTYDDLMKIIIITGYPTYDTAIDAIRSGIFDYVSKSANHQVILKKINGAIEERNQTLNLKKKNRENAKNIILVGHHLLFKEGMENFCAENPEFNLLHNYYSCEHIKKTDFNRHGTLVLLCEGCNRELLEYDENIFDNLKIFFPNGRMIVINCSQEEDRQVKWIRSGVKGFLPPNFDKKELGKALNSVLAGEIWASRRLMNRVLTELLQDTERKTYKKPSNTFNLSNREIEILQVMASGLSNFEISEKLFLSEKTVKTHIHHIFKKMGVKSRTEAAMHAIKHSII